MIQPRWTQQNKKQTQKVKVNMQLLYRTNKTNNIFSLKVSLRNRFFGLVEGPTVHQESAKKQITVTLVKDPHSTKKQTHGYTMEEPTVHPRNKPQSHWGGPIIQYNHGHARAK